MAFLNKSWVAKAVFVGLIQAAIVMAFVMSRSAESGTVAYCVEPLSESAWPTLPVP